MALLKAGGRLRSAVCTTEVIVVKAPAREVEVTCGGTPMLGSDADTAAASAPAGTGEPTLLGKRYVNAEEDLEVLCTKAGDGWLAVDDEPLVMKDAKPLPSSD